MKNGLFTTMSAEKEVRVGEVTHRKGKQRRKSTKRMLSMWWDWKGPVFYELLPKNKTINSDFYYEQLQKLSDAIAQKRPELINRKGMVFHHTMHTQVLGHSAKIATWLGCVTTV